MKKSGFTLSEILIALSIVGVVAALTLPSLFTDTATAQVGPKLAKAVSMFEQANESLLDAYSVESILDTGLFDGTTPEETYGEALSDYLKISEFDYTNSGVSQKVTVGTSSTSCSAYFVGATFDKGTPFISKDGIIYVIGKGSTVSGSTPQKTRIGTVFIDINGIKSPNSAGADIFAFAWYADGSLRPVGASNWVEGITGSVVTCTWQTKCQNDTTPTDYWACAGSIFDNGLKVLYK